VHWYWRVHAHVGATRTALQAGDVERARIEASRLTHVALSTDDPNLHALAWEACAPGRATGRIELGRGGDVSRSRRWPR
jgi:hypothetical protein